MTQFPKGLIALILAQTMWGLSPLYYKAVAHVPAPEVLAHRTLWTFVLFGAWIAVQGRLSELKTLLFGAQWRRVWAASILVSTNWVLFIYAIQSGQGIEGALGYYIFPLVATVIGVFVFDERLRGLQIPALGLAILAVIVLALGVGRLPWLALSLALTFATYGAIKKTLGAGPILTVTAEVVFLAPIALIYLIGAQLYGWGGTATQTAGAFGHTVYDTAMLIFAGLVTGVPLIFFATAARLLPLTVVGMGQYWNSSLQLAVAVFVFSEPFTTAHSIAMPMIWIALVLYSVQALRQERARRVGASVFGAD